MITKKIPLTVKCPNCLKVFKPVGAQTPNFYETYGSVHNKLVLTCDHCGVLIDVALVARPKLQKRADKKGAKK